MAPAGGSWYPAVDVWPLHEGVVVQAWVVGVVSDTVHVKFALETALVWASVRVTLAEE